MKRKGTALGSSVEEYVVLEWSKYEDRPTKRHGIEDMLSSGDTNSNTSMGLGDEVHTPLLLWSDTTLEEYETHRSALIRGEDGMQRICFLLGEEDSVQSGSAKRGHEGRAQRVGALR